MIFLFLTRPTRPDEPAMSSIRLHGPRKDCNPTGPQPIAATGLLVAVLGVGGCRLWFHDGSIFQCLEGPQKTGCNLSPSIQDGFSRAQAYFLVDGR